MATLTVTLVTKDGAVDQDASRQAFNAALATYVAERETEQSTIASAVAAVFDRHPGQPINMPALASMVLASLNVQPENYSALENLVLGYVRENESQNRADGKLFKIGKGKGGGCRRWSDIPVEAPAASK